MSRCLVTCLLLLFGGLSGCHLLNQRAGEAEESWTAGLSREDSVSEAVPEEEGADPFPPAESTIQDTLSETILPEATVAEDSLHIPFGAEAGETWQLRVRNEQRRSDAGKIVRDDTLDCLIDVMVLQHNDEGVVFEWVYRNFSNIAANPLSMLDNTGFLLRNKPIYFQTNASGRPLRVINAAALTDSLEQSLAAQVKLAGEQRLPGALEKQKLQKIALELLSDSAVTAQLLQPPAWLHIASGQSFLPGDTLFYEVRLKNILGGKPLPGRGFLTLQRDAGRENFAEAHWGSDVDPAVAGRFILEFLQNVSRQAQTSIEFEELPTFTISERAVLQIDMHLGQILQSDYTRVTRALTLEQRERTIITRVRP